MQQLHLVGFTTNHDGLIFSVRRGAKSGSFTVQIDDALVGMITEAQRLRAAEHAVVPPSHHGEPKSESAGAVGGPMPRKAAQAAPPEPPKPPIRLPRPPSHLSVREMQERLRAGHSIEDVAAEARVEAEWVERFAAPIQDEQARVVDAARALVYAKPRLGNSSRPLGESVARNLSDRGIALVPDELDAGWSAYQFHDTVWVVRFRYMNRRKVQQAEWEVDLQEGRLTASDRLASELAFVERGRRLRRRVAAKAVRARRARKATTRKAPARKATARKAPARKTTARKTARKTTAGKAPARKTTARKTTARKTAAGRTRGRRVTRTR